ncbi:MAG: hypothetical protein Q9222_006636, partial [Ikaeria aurantiellina]
HRELGTPCGPRRRYEPARVVVFHRRRLPIGPGTSRHQRIQVWSIERTRPHSGEQREAGHGFGHRRGMVRKLAPTQQRAGSGRGREIGDVVRQQAEIGRHPDRADAKAGPHRFEHEVAVLRLHDDTVAKPDALIGQYSGHRRYPRIELGPAPAPLAFPYPFLSPKLCNRSPIK